MPPLALQVEEFWDEVMNDQRLRHLKHCLAHLEGSRMAGGIGCGWKVDVTDHLAEINGYGVSMEYSMMQRWTDWDRFNEFHLKDRYICTLSCDIHVAYLVHVASSRQHLPGAIPGSMGRSLIESLIFWITPKNGSTKADGHWTWD